MSNDRSARPARRGLGRGLGSLSPTAPAPSGAPPADEPSAGEGVDPSAHGPGAQASGAQGEGAQGLAAPGPAPLGATAHGGTSAGEGPVLVAGAYFAELPVTAITPNPRQPREVFDEEAMAELVVSIREVGLLQPIVVRPLGEDRYELIMGERRWRASQEAGLTEIPAIVRETEDGDLLRDALLENLHRSQLNPLEEASAYQQLLEDFGITQEELATRIGRSRPQISNTIRLLKLPVPVQQRVAAGVLTAGHARAILALEEVEAMQRLADKIVNEDLSVRAAEAAAKAPDAGARRTVNPQAGARRAHLDEVALKLGDRLNTRVRIGLGARKGQVVIDFASIQDLNRILEELGESGYGNS